VDGDGAVAGEFEVHAEELVFRSARDSHFSEVALEHCDDLVDGGRADVGYFGVVNVPDDGALGAVDGGVCHAEIVRVDSETVFL
jgi:hypothetical protein